MWRWDFFLFTLLLRRLLSIKKWGQCACRKYNHSGGFRGWGSPPPFFSPEIYYQMLVKLKVWDPKYVNVLQFQGISPLFLFSGSATESWKRYSRVATNAGTLTGTYIWKPKFRSVQLYHGVIGLVTSTSDSSDLVTSRASSLKIWWVYKQTVCFAFMIWILSKTLTVTSQ
jgi:hypothetical protein